MISKDDYLKKYVGSAGKREKRNKAIKTTAVKSSNTRMRIIDDDVPFIVSEDATPTVAKEVEEVEKPDNPVVVLVGSRADELQMIGKFKVSNWNDLEETSRNESNKCRHSPSSSKDISPVRKRTRHDSDDEDDDVVCLKQKLKNEKDNSPPRRRRHDSSGDDGKRLSPKRCKNDEDYSPVRRHRHDSSDNDEKDLSPKRSKRLEDKSPPRRRRHDSSDDIQEDITPKKSKRSEDQSPSRRRRYDSTPLSTVGADSLSKSNNSPKKIKMTLTGAKAGLQNAKELRKEMKELKRRDRNIFENADAETIGRNAEAIVRKKQIVDKKKKKELTEEEKKRHEEIKDKFKVWNKGVKQVQDREEKLKEMADVAEKPLARYKDDKDLDAHLKEQMMKDDPMLAYMQEKRIKEGKAAPIREVYKGPPAPENRYGIMPGFRWDGVDRSNGFEKTLLSQSNLRKADEDEYYQWSSGRYE